MYGVEFKPFKKENVSNLTILIEKASKLIINSNLKPFELDNLQIRGILNFIFSNRGILKSNNVYMRTNLYNFSAKNFKLKTN